MKNLKYLNVILTVIAILLALLVWEQRLVIRDDFILNRLTSKTSLPIQHFDLDGWRQDQTRFNLNSWRHDYFTKEILGDSS